MSLKILIFLTITSFLLIHWGPLNSYFSQDDFFHLRQVLGKSYLDIPSFFLPWNDLGYAFYRPLSRELYGFLMLNLFNLNPLPYHIVNALLILLVGICTFKFVGLVTKNTLVQLLAIFFYSLSAVHSVELYYLSSSQTLFAAFFVMLTLINYYKYLEYDKFSHFLLSAIFFFLGIISHESAVVVIPIVGILSLYKKGLGFIFSKSFFLLTLPFLLIFSMRILIYLLTYQLPNEEVYKPSFIPGKILNTLIWYVLWSFGLPEMLVDFMTLTLKFNPNFFIWYRDFSLVVFPSFILLALSLFFLIFKNKLKILSERSFYIFLILLLTSLLPFIVFPSHKFVYYLSLPIVFFSALLATIIISGLKKSLISNLVIVLVLITYALISSFTNFLNGITYWAAKRANAAKAIISKVTTSYPDPKPQTIFFFKDDPNYPEISKEWGSSSKQAFYILSNSDAFQLVYNDPTIKVIYEGLDGNVKGVKSGEIYTVVAKFPY